MNRSRLLYLLGLLLVLLLFAALTYSSFRNETDNHLNYRSTELNSSVESIRASYGRLVEAFFQKEVNTQPIIDLLEQASRGGPTEQARLRGQLYRKLYPTFRLLQQRNIRVLHFVLEDGSSFLRFHRPDLFGDRIADDRGLLSRVLKEKRTLQGFEHGRVYPGFRYAFPLLKNGNVVGMVDFSAAYDAFSDLLAETEGHVGGYSQMVLKADQVWHISHPSVHSLFRPSQVHADFLVEDEHSSLRDITLPTAIPDYFNPLTQHLAQEDAVRKAMDQGVARALYSCVDWSDCYQLVLLPVLDGQQRAAAYIIGSFPGPEYPSLVIKYLAVFVVGSLLLVLGARYYRHWLKSRQRLLTISANMAEGLYVMDNQGLIIFCNAAGERMLGLSSQYLLGRSGHDLFHHHSEDQPVSAEHCPIRVKPLSGQVFRGNNEIFRHNNGDLIRVEVTSSPLQEEGAITGAVVLFRDIGLEYASRLRLQQTEVAFHNMAEAVVMTDANANIVAVNRAFSEITGYSEAEALGRNPRMLASGRHDPSFYRALWQSLLSLGYWEGEIWNRRKNGEIYPEWINMTAIQDSEGVVTSYVCVFSDITEKRKKEKRLQELAFNDQLTGLPNRTAFQRLFEQALLHAKRHQSRVALLYIDLDRFKQINDTLGHTLGDQLLEEVAQRLRQSLRQDDVVARLGGDEFVLMIEAFEQGDDPARVANKVLHCLRDPVVIEQRNLYVTASIGISVFPEDGQDAVTLLKNADSAMYRSKRAGRNGYSYFTDDMAREAEEHFAIEADLRLALAGKRELEIHYQPKLSLGERCLVGSEALIRWRHPQRGMVMPGDFLPVAHEAGLMPELTDCVLRQVARQIRAWGDLGIDPGVVSINLDDQTINTKNVSHYLQRIVLDEGISPQQIELEITETVILEHGRTLDLYRELVQAGFSLSIDDFGTGESSLFRLKHLPVQTLKIDRSFVMDIEKSERDLAILGSIIDMAKSLGKRVLCEGVENQEQFLLLCSVECDEIQGYFLARPMPAEAMTQFLTQFAQQGLQLPGLATSVAVGSE